MHFCEQYENTLTESSHGIAMKARHCNCSHINLFEIFFVLVTQMANGFGDSVKMAG
jgi:hypothetical protein